MESSALLFVWLISPKQSFEVAWSSILILNPPSPKKRCVLFRSKSPASDGDNALAGTPLVLKWPQC